MNRRTFLKGATAAALPAAASAAQVHALATDMDELTVAALAQAYEAGRETAVSIARKYLERITRIDRAGPAINSVIELNPDALAIAESLDRERAAGRVRGPLHGVPLLIKDNIATGDRMRTSAGSLALAESIAARDAFIVTRLREAGCVILGKTNLSEWANFRGKQSVSGWSARGGYTRNPYSLARNPSGSSSGSAVAIAANLAVLAVGTETDGSITSPAAVNGIVGFKPTLGWVSRHGIVPIAASQDTAGPMCRTVMDAALLFEAMAGSDAHDAATQRRGRPRRVDVASTLARATLKGVRLGVVRNLAGYHAHLDRVFEAALADLRALGATLVDPANVPNTDKYAESELDVLMFEIKHGLPRYLREFAPDAPVKTLADVIAFNERERDRELEGFGQEWFVQAEAKRSLRDPSYRAALARNHRYARRDGIDHALAKHKLDALVAPTCGPAWLTDLVNGDPSGGSATSPAAVAGYPHITVPMGEVKGLPVGLSFFSTAWRDAQLLRYAYAYEQATRRRIAPRFAET